MSIDLLLKIVPDKRRLYSCFSKKKKATHMFQDLKNLKKHRQNRRWACVNTT